jgi:phosphate transport system substrate-binding protein
MKRFLSVCLLATFALPDLALARDIRLSGSSTIAPVMLEIGKLYEASSPETRIFVETGGSGKGLVDLRKGLVDIAMVSREMTAEEADLQTHTIAYDGIAALVPADNPLSELSDDALRSIFTGEVRNWSELGGPDQPIVVVAKGEGRATSEVFNAYLGLTPDQIKGDLVAAENAQMIKTVSVTPGSIGYVSIGAAQLDIGYGVPVKLIALGKVAPTADHVADGSYGAVRPLNLVTNGSTSADVAGLIAFSQSPEVAEIIRALTFVPVRP